LQPKPAIIVFTFEGAAFLHQSSAKKQQKSQKQ